MNGAEALEEGKALVDSGDLDLAKYRENYKRIIGRDSILTDDQLIVVCMTPDDDQDDEDWVKDMVLAENSLTQTAAA